jgi:hypothetical protein
VQVVRVWFKAPSRDLEQLDLAYAAQYDSYTGAAEPAAAEL